MPQVIVNKRKWKEAVEGLELSRELAKQAYCMEFMESRRLLPKHMVWFRAERVKTDGTNASDPGGFTTHSNVQVFSDAMYFRGTDDKVWWFSFGEGTLQDFAAAVVETLQGWYSWDSGRWNGWWNSASALNALPRMFASD